VDDSLKRLQTDYLDLYYAHRDDESVSQVEYMGAFNELVEVGKVREIGASNFTYDRLTSANTVAKEVGHQPFTVAQDRYNLIERGLEEVLNHLDGIGVTELPYAALAGGFLTGKYRAGIPVESARAGNARKYLDNPRNITLLGALDVIAAAHGVSVTAVSLAWLRQQHGVGAPIASARTTEQLEHLIESFELFLTNDELASLS
jgi:aryl-alcohol dehydrogenase-like predicted oxidoreductase